MAYDQAAITCNVSGSHLVTVDSREENDFLLSLAAGTDAWIGYNDIAKEGSFKWIHGESNFTDWYPGEPNNGIGFGIGFEDCGILGHPVGIVYWNDVNCATSHVGFCGRELPKATCIDSYMAHGSNCENIRQEKHTMQFRIVI